MNAGTSVTSVIACDVHEISSYQQWLWQLISYGISQVEIRLGFRSVVISIIQNEQPSVDELTYIRRNQYSYRSEMPEYLTCIYNVCTAMVWTLTCLRFGTREWYEANIPGVMMRLFSNIAEEERHNPRISIQKVLLTFRPRTRIPTTVLLGRS